MLQCRTARHRGECPEPLHAVQVIRLLGLADAHVKRRVAELQASLKTHELERVQVRPPDRCREAWRVSQALNAAQADSVGVHACER